MGIAGFDGSGAAFMAKAALAHQVNPVSLLITTTSVDAAA